MSARLLHVYVAFQILAAGLRGRLTRDDRGEGVISAAIAILVMAAVGALMWLAFREIFADASEKVQDNVEKIGG